MKIYLIPLFAALILSSCVAAKKSARQSIEADELLFITKKTLESMDNCTESKKSKYCKKAKYYFEEYPWLRTRKVDITNNNLMTQNEWEIQIQLIRKNLRTIKSKYAAYHQVAKKL